MVKLLLGLSTGIERQLRELWTTALRSSWIFDVSSFGIKKKINGHVVDMHVDTAPPEYCISTRKEKIDHLPNRRSLAGWYSTKRNTRQPAQPNRNTLRCSRSDFSPLLDDVDGLALLPFGCVLNVRNRHHWNPIGNTIVFAKNAPQRLTFVQQYGSVKVSVQ
jgi:hypothetical protein